MMQNTNTYKPIELIHTPGPMDLWEYSQNYIKDTQNSLIHIIKSPTLIANWFTEISWWVWSLWNLQLNIPVFKELISQLSLSDTSDFTKKILITNYNLLKNYFRNHILMWNIIKARPLLEIKNISHTYLEPLISLYNEHLWTKISLNKLLGINSVFDLIYETELLFQDIGTWLDQQGTTVVYDSWVQSVDNYIAQKSCLNPIDMQGHKETLTSTLSFLQGSKDTIKSILIYWSIATNTAKPQSDLFDGITVLDRTLLQDKDLFQATISNIIDANRYLLKNWEITHKHPFHYMFDNDLDCISPHFKKSFQQNFEVIQWQNIESITWFENHDYDTHYWKYKFFNLYQKAIKQFHRINIWKISINHKVYLKELRTFMKKWFALGALSTKGITIHENDTNTIFMQTFPQCAETYNQILNNLNTHQDQDFSDIFSSIIDLYCDLINSIYLQTS